MLNRVAFGAFHIFNLLRNVMPIDTIDSLIQGKPPEQVGLVFQSGEDVPLIDIV